VSEEPLTAAQKLAEIERMIEDLRWVRRTPGTPEGLSYRVLKAVALDLRARSQPSTQVFEALDFQVRSALKAKARLGYIEMGNHQAVSEALLAHWSTVSAALERFEETKKQQGNEDDEDKGHRINT
jgi:hypothetical protein